MPQNYTTALCDRTSKSIDKGALKSAPARFQLSKRTAQKPIVSVTRVAPPRCVSSRAGFLAAYRETAGIEAAAKAVGIAPTRHFEWLERVAAYRQVFADVQLEVTDTLQDQVVERAKEGWLEPVFYRGRQCGSIRRYDNHLVMFLLKAFMPEKYG